MLNGTVANVWDFPYILWTFPIFTPRSTHSMPVRRGPVVDGRTRGLCKSPNDDIELGTAGNDFHFEFFYIWINILKPGFEHFIFNIGHLRSLKRDADWRCVLFDWAMFEFGYRSSRVPFNFISRRERLRDIIFWKFSSLQRFNKRIPNEFITESSIKNVDFNLITNHFG